MDHKAFMKSLPAGEKGRLTERSDAAGLRHLALHSGLILLLAVLIAAEVPFWWVLLLPQGLLIAFLFTLQHEATHKTPFENEEINEWVGWACGILIFQPFLWFRYFHLAHHRYTQDPENDPELLGLPKPDDWRSFAWHVSCIGYWKDKAVLLWSNAFGTIDSPYLPDRVHDRLRAEARRMLALYTVLLMFTLFATPVLIWIWLVPLAVGFPFLRVYLLAEHGRLRYVADMFDNTRTTFTNAIVQFLAWNMPYHVEHHVFPQVPFYLLPEFHRLTHEKILHSCNGYSAFAREYTAGFDD